MKINFVNEVDGTLASLDLQIVPRQGDFICLHGTYFKVQSITWFLKPQKVCTHPKPCALMECSAPPIECVKVSLGE